VFLETESTIEEEILGPYKHLEPEPRFFHEVGQNSAKDWGGGAD